MSRFVSTTNLKPDAVLDAFFKKYKYYNVKNTVKRSKICVKVRYHKQNCWKHRVI